MLLTAVNSIGNQVTLKLLVDYSFQGLAEGTKDDHLPPGLDVHGITRHCHWRNHSMLMMGVMTLLTQLK